MFTINLLRNYCSKATRFNIYPSLTRTKNRSLVESIAVSKDNQAFYAWHPEKEIPYEFTRPLPDTREINRVSLMKEEKLEEAMKADRHDFRGLAQEKLSALTFTTKHRWYPRSRDKKAKKTPMNRPYL